MPRPASGVGRACAREFARRGARLALIARGSDGLEAARREVIELGGQASIFALDVWVNDAMVSVLAPIAQTTAEEIRRVTEVTYLGTVHVTLAAPDESTGPRSDRAGWLGADLPRDPVAGGLLRRQARCRT